MLQEQAQGATFALPNSADKMYFMFLLDSSPATSQHQPRVRHIPQSNPIFEHLQTLSVHDGQQGSSCLLVFGPAQLAPERATCWLKGLMAVVQPQHTLVITSLPVRLLPYQASSAWYSCIMAQISKHSSSDCGACKCHVVALRHTRQEEVQAACNLVNELRRLI